VTGAHFSDDVGLESFVVCFPEQGRGITDDTDGQGFLFRGRLLGHADGGVQAFGFDVGETEFDAFVDNGFVDINVDADTAVHVHGPGLIGSHSAVTRCQENPSHQRTVEMLVGNGAQGLECALDDALGSNIFPRCRRVLREHGQVLVLKIIKCGPGGLHDVGGGHDHTGSKLVGFKYGNRHARLHHQGLVVFHVLEGIHDGVVRFPVSSTLADAPVDNQIFRCFGVFHIVFQHS